MEVLLGIISGVAIAALSSWITIQLSLKQFRTEKWWELKANAYSNLLGSLHDAKSFADENLEADMRARELTKEQDQNLRSRAKKAEEEIYRAMDVGAFYLSKRALERLRDYKIDASKSGDMNSWVEYLESDWSAADSCLKDMINIAKEDLQVS